jgi:diguanylate cyclase
MVISLKKYLDLSPDELKKRLGPDAADLLTATVQSYRSALLNMGNCGAQACPPLGAELQRGLSRITERLSKDITPQLLQETDERVEQQLQQWGEHSSEYLKKKVDEIKEVLLLLTSTAEANAQRDQRYAAQFSSFTERLQKMARLEDLPSIRASLLQSAGDLKSCVQKMEQDGRESATLLKAEVVMYQTKLEEAEQRACRDALTGLDNRCSVESIMERRIAHERPFCVAMIDLNGFKQVNDQHGHPAGDDLLKQVATEMRSMARATDVVGRWGGDEFLVLLADCDLAQSQTFIERQRRWLFGEYTIQTGEEKLKVDVSAAVGLAEWKRGESMADLVARADTAMYKDKVAARKKARE